jgi:osomolarity two-component system response regulator SKN7
MNDVLPKPFTKEGMLRILEKHLSAFKKNPSFPNSAPMQHPSGFVTPNQSQAPLGLNMGQLSAAQSLKDDTSPGKSPATATSWQSPNQLPGTSPITAQGGYMQQPTNGAYTMTPTHQNHPQFPTQNPAMAAPRGAPQQHRRVMSDMTGGPVPDDHPDAKRQRMYAPPTGNFPQ